MTDPRTPVPATDRDRERAAAAILAAVDDGRLELDEGGRRLSAAYRAATVAGLSALLADLVPRDHGRPGETKPPTADRAQYVWAAVRVVACALIAAALLVLMLRGLDPTVLR